MKTSWRTVTAAEFCNSVRDGTHASPKAVPDGELLITSRHIIGGRVDLSNAYRISREDFEETNRRSKVDRWDVLISMIGTVGEPCLIQNEPNFAIKNIGLFKNKSELEGRWLYYYLKSPDAQELIRAHSRGSTQQYIPLGALRELPINLPRDRQEMNAIVEILAALDDKIEQNRRTGRALEGLARATFKAWFVDFEPVKAKAAGQTSFPGMPPATFATLPDRLTNSPLGQIPEGWDAPDSVADLESKGWLLIGDGYRAKRTELADVGVPFIRAGNVNGTVQTGDAELLGSPAVAKAGVKRSQTWDTVFTSKGTVGRIGLVTPAVGEVVYAPQVCFWRSTNADLLSPFLLHLWMKSDCFTNQWMSVKGQTDMADFVSLSDQRAMTMLVPPREIQRGFETLARQLIELQAILEAESSKLAALRDYLLPRLLSGRVRLAAFATAGGA